MDEMLAAYAAAVREKDVDAFVGLYADDVRTFDLWNVWTYDGKAVLREMVSEWFGSLGADETVAVEFDEVRTQAKTSPRSARSPPSGRCRRRATSCAR